MFFILSEGGGQNFINVHKGGPVFLLRSKGGPEKNGDGLSQMDASPLRVKMVALFFSSF